MKNENSAKKSLIKKNVTIKYHVDGKSMWSKGSVKDDEPHGYWQWYRKDGTLKRSGNFDKGTPVGEWITYDKDGKVYKVTQKK